jgi:hypothetical protein
VCGWNYLRKPSRAERSIARSAKTRFGRQSCDGLCDNPWIGIGRRGSIEPIGRTRQPRNSRDLSRVCSSFAGYPFLGNDFPGIADDLKKAGGCRALRRAFQNPFLRRLALILRRGCLYTPTPKGLYFTRFRMAQTVTTRERSASFAAAHSIVFWAVEFTGSPWGMVR